MTDYAPFIVADESWMARANCTGVDKAVFFPVRGASQNQAKAICAECTVRDECLDYAMRFVVREGIWGGLSERQRRRLRKERADERIAAGGTRAGRAATKHGAAIRKVLADGQWHTLDELVAAAAKALDTDDLVLAKKRTNTVLWNMGRDACGRSTLLGEGQRRHRRYRLDD